MARLHTGMGSLPAHPHPPPLPPETVGLHHCLHGCSEYTCLLPAGPTTPNQTCCYCVPVGYFGSSKNPEVCEDCYLHLGRSHDGWTAVQVVSRLGDIDQIHGLTRSILADTNLGKAVNRLARLGNTKPSIAACEQIASKARSSHYLHNSLPLSQHRPDLCDAHASTQGAEGHD